MSKRLTKQEKQDLINKENLATKSIEVLKNILIDLEQPRLSSGTPETIKQEKEFYNNLKESIKEEIDKRR